MTYKLNPELVELCRPSPHACVEGRKRIEMLEGLAKAVSYWRGLPNRVHRVWSALHAIERDNERVDHLQKDYDATVERLEARPNGGWLRLDK